MGSQLLVSLAYWSDWHEATAPQDNSLVHAHKGAPGRMHGRLSVCFITASKRKRSLDACGAVGAKKKSSDPGLWLLSVPYLRLSPADRQAVIP
jgi:hypothetical protein